MQTVKHFASHTVVGLNEGPSPSAFGEWASGADQPWAGWGFRMPLAEPGVHLSICTGLSIDVYA